MKNDYVEYEEIYLLFLYERELAILIRPENQMNVY